MTRVGALPFAFTPEAYRQIEELSALGCTIAEICGVMGCPLDRFYRQRQHEVEQSGEQGSRLVQAIFAGQARLRKSLREALVHKALKIQHGQTLIFLAKELLHMGSNGQENQGSTDLRRLPDAEVVAAVSAKCENKQQSDMASSDSGHLDAPGEVD